MSRIAAALIAVLAASPAFAHTGGALVAGLASGFAHPFSGLDHLLAIIAVGLWAAQGGGRAVWLLPIAFPVAMALGAVVGASGVELPEVEIGIALSVLALGALVAFAVRLPALGGAALVAVFAVLHGHAHGAEVPAAADPIGYGAAFILATVILHLIGIGLGLSFKSPRAERFVRAGGAAIALAGVSLISAIA